MPDGVQLEHRLSSIERELQAGMERIAAEIRTGTIETRGMKEQLQRQNGRVTKLEEWRQIQETAAAFARGVADGRAGITRTQMAILALVGPLVFAGADLAIRLVL